ncbi:hypothetical protein B0J18DRAFT_433007 [Chaetomium sp. MPI-SDFR-AT-0129]|nr:hypothetical protein B0J18DRAFT_433007 [Chaetomium sp. MPI-SDFR-AT-0129]
MSRLLRPLHSLRSLPSSPLTNIQHQMVQTRLSSSFMQSSPSPPRLPADQQAEFERLQRAAEAALSSHTTISTDSAGTAATGTGRTSPLTTSRHVTTPSDTAQAAQTTQTTTQTTQQTNTAAGEDPETAAAGTFSGGIRKGTPPEFEGDVHPKTGEVGGPKNEPLRWGSGGDWSFNGRVTDF